MSLGEFSEAYADQEGIDVSIGERRPSKERSQLNSQTVEHPKLIGAQLTTERC